MRRLNLLIFLSNKSGCLLICSLWHLEKENETPSSLVFVEKSNRRIRYRSIFLIFTTGANQRRHDGLARISGSTDVIRDRCIPSRRAGPPCPSTVPQVPGSKTSRAARAAYISQNQIASKVHSPGSSSASKEVGGDTPSTMQALVSAIPPLIFEGYLHRFFTAFIVSKNFDFFF